MTRRTCTSGASATDSPTTQADAPTARPLPRPPPAPQAGLGADRVGPRSGPPAAGRTSPADWDRDPHVLPEGHRPQVHRRLHQVRPRADLSCLTDDIRWTVFGAFRLEGKEAYDAEIENPAFTGSPKITITRMVEEGDVVMAEMSLEAQRATGETMRAAMGEVFVFSDGKISERRASVIELEENDFK